MTSFRSSPRAHLRRELSFIEKDCLIPPHNGYGSFGDNGTTIEAKFLVTRTGDGLIFLSGSSRHFPGFGFIDPPLIIQGEGPEGSFELRCPQLAVEAELTASGKQSWAVATPLNQGVQITYRTSPIAKVQALVNNFDPEATASGMLDVVASGRSVRFEAAPGKQHRRDLLSIGLIRSAPLTSFTFDAWPGSDEQDLLQFAKNIADLCSFATQLHTGIPVVSFLDEENHPIKRFIRPPVVSEFRENGILNSRRLPNAIPALFESCLDEYAKMIASTLPWQKLSTYCASIQDPPYLEQKFSSLMSALEFFLKNCLIEKGIHPPAKLQEALNAAKAFLGWELPKHYAAGDLHRLLRNAVVHGGELPTGNSREFRDIFDKWNLFLARRVLIRLGYKGKVLCSHCGYPATSDVADFSEEFNTPRCG